jgi:hypothetical protein
LAIGNYPRSEATRDLKIKSIAERRIWMHGIVLFGAIFLILGRLTANTADPDLWRYLSFGRLFWNRDGFPEYVAREYFEFAAGGPDSRKFLDKYPHNLILLQHDNYICEIIRKQSDWKQIYIDADSVLFMRDKK